jgi:UDP-N-acetyl-D-galactosamine dehydrogenase
VSLFETQAVANLTDGVIGVIGLGYVGLPLAVEFGKARKVIAFDVNGLRIKELRKGVDSTLEVCKADLDGAQHLTFTSKLTDLKRANVFIVTVPTPIDNKKKPDLRSLLGASKAIGTVIKCGDVVIYESTVYPGCTEEDCLPVIERESGLMLNKHFFAGYSPERINPGDKANNLKTIVKVTSGSTPVISKAIDKMYRDIVTAGTFLAASIKTAEAAKVIENTQRDLNIALINELAVIFAKMGIDTADVLEAAQTKWNFLPFKPGLVGGHCIGVDPFYLTYKAEKVGCSPNVILAGRATNDGMAAYVVETTKIAMVKKDIPVSGAAVLVMGLAFKENCPDIRNSKVADVVRGFEAIGCTVDVFDPWVSSLAARKEYGISLLTDIENNKYQAILIAVAHDEIKAMGPEKIRKMGCGNAVIFDLKHCFDKNESDLRL